MSLGMKLRELRWRAAGHYTQPLGDDWVEPLRGGRGLEVGGPSAVFRSGGLLPVYPVLGALDGIQIPTAHATWHGELREGPYETGQPRLTGRLWLREGGDLEPLPTDHYDAILSSHVIEHFANPLRALQEWLRVLQPGGYLLTVLPHKQGCADHRRATTSLPHLEQDERAGIGEDDLGHTAEVIELHDLARDPAAGDPDAHRERTLANATTRAMHHHVFTTRSALRLLDRLGLELLAVEARWPHDIYVLARAPETAGERPDNAGLLSADAPFRRSSPFSVDRAGEDGS
jgi:SAM-dependent methyltransferase